MSNRNELAAAHPGALRQVQECARAVLRARRPPLTPGAAEVPVVLGLVWRGTWPGEEELPVDGTIFRVVQSNSVLALRAALTQAEGEGQPVILLTGLAEADLGADLVARLARRQLLTPSLRESLLGRYQARDLDPFIARHRWFAELLLDAGTGAPGGGVAPAGFLDLETAWTDVLDGCLGLAYGARPTAVDLLRWAGEPATVARLGAFPSAGSAALEGWLRESAGAVAVPLLRAARADHGGDAWALGLALGALGRTPPEQAAARRDALIRLERWTDYREVPPAVATAWAAAAERLAATAQTGGVDLRPELERAQALLGELGASEHARWSPWLPAGLEQRLEAAGRELSRLAAPVFPPPGTMDTARQAVLFALAHCGLSTNPGRARTLTMALRLAAWRDATRGLSPRPVLPGPAEAAAFAWDYPRSGAYLDLARQALAQSAEPNPELAEAYSHLLAAVGVEREGHNARFGRSLPQWAVSAEILPGSGEPPWGVEEVLARVVAPLVERQPVLVLLLDGLSWPVWLELSVDLAAAGWAEIIPAGRASWPPILAALPTLTAVSRASFWAGGLRNGDAPEEARTFSRHPALERALSGRPRPVLLHKGAAFDLLGVARLSEEAADEVRQARRPVVGVVLNAVDDTLAKGDQVAPRWSRDTLPLLETLLTAARAAGRVVVVASDHGHVLEAGTEFRAAPSGSGDRHRPGPPAPGDGEALLEGPRVLSPAGSPPRVALWSERLRYTSGRRRGYHGGVSLQEAVVPLSVLSARPAPPDGWTPARTPVPAWWAVPAFRSEGPLEGSGLVVPPVATLPSDDPMVAGLPLFPTS